MINNSIAIYVISCMLEGYTYRESITKGKEMIPFFKQQLKGNGFKDGKIIKSKFISACWDELAEQEKDGIYNIETINNVKLQLPYM